LLDVLVPRFEKEQGIKVKVIAVGSGAALRMAERGDVDVVLVHSPTSEQHYVEAGDLVDGRLVMHNDFLIVGPMDDPARYRKLTSITEAMRAIAARSVFISRGDDSGRTPRSSRCGPPHGSIRNRSPAVKRRARVWARRSTSRIRSAPTRSRTEALTSLCARSLGLAILFQGDPSLRNVYHVYVVNPKKHPSIKAAEARSFIDFLVSAPIQQWIASFGRDKYGESLFFPDAVH